MSVLIWIQFFKKKKSQLTATKNMNNYPTCKKITDVLWQQGDIHQVNILDVFVRRSVVKRYIAALKNANDMRPTSNLRI